MGVIENVKEVTTLIQKIDNIELYKKILDLQGEILTLVDENRKLKSELDDLKERQKVRDSLVFDHSVYMLKKSDGQESGPFCAPCWDGGKKLVRLSDYDHPEYLWCQVCDKRPRTRRRPVG